MNPQPPTAHERVRHVMEALSAFWQDRTVGLLVPRFASSSRVLVDELEQCGARVKAVVTGSEPEPSAPRIEHMFSAVQSGVRLDRSDFERWLLKPDVSLSLWFDRIDPGRKLLLLGTVFTEVSNVCGRPVHGWRPREWVEWEDKTLVDDRLRAIGVPTPGNIVLSSSDPSAVSHASEFDNGYGVVIAMDASLGNWGDARQLFWARNRHQVEEALQQLKAQSSRIRIATFETGVPCSILGMVLDTGIAVFEPIEIVTLRRAMATRLLFCGSSNRWRPGADARREMREYARRLGAALAAQVGYRGMYSLDGILTPRGFVATEVNPRHASGLGLRAGWPLFPTYLFARAVQQRLAATVQVSASDVESAFGEVIRTNPSHSIAVPFAAADEMSNPVERRTEVTTSDGRQTVRYVHRGNSVRLLEVEPQATCGVMSTVTAALVRAISGENMYSFADDEPRH